MRETNAALLKTERKKSTLIRCYKQKGARKPFDVLQRFWSKLNEFNETRRGERNGFAVEKCWVYRLNCFKWSAVSEKCFQSLVNRMEQFL